MILGEYAAENDIILIGVQDTGSGKQWKTLSNRKTLYDINNSLNRAGLYDYC